MSSISRKARVSPAGTIVLVGVPIAPGTEVEVTITLPSGTRIRPRPVTSEDWQPIGSGERLDAWEVLRDSA